MSGWMFSFYKIKNGNGKRGESSWEWVWVSQGVWKEERVRRVGDGDAALECCRAVVVKPYSKILHWPLPPHAASHHPTQTHHPKAASGVHATNGEN